MASYDIGDLGIPRETEYDQLQRTVHQLSNTPNVWNQL